MLKRIAAWLTSIIRAEIEQASKLEKEANDKVIADLHASLLQHIERYVETAVADVKKHISAELAEIHEPLKTAAAQEIAKNFENILSHTKVAAQEALADARRTLRMVCNICGHLSWKFTINQDGKVVCGNCQSKGAK